MSFFEVTLSLSISVHYEETESRFWEQILNFSRFLERLDYPHVLWFQIN